MRFSLIASSAMKRCFVPIIIDDCAAHAKGSVRYLVLLFYQAQPLQPYAYHDAALAHSWLCGACAFGALVIIRCGAMQCFVSAMPCTWLRQVQWYRLLLLLNSAKFKQFELCILSKFSHGELVATSYSFVSIAIPLPWLFPVIN